MSNVSTRLVRRIRSLSRVLPVSDALMMSLRENVRCEILVRLSSTGQPIVVRGATSDTACFNKVFLAQEYELPFDHTPTVIVDAGANVGMATVYFANTYPQARVLAIEPAPDNFGLLKRNCGHLSNVTLLQAALWPRHAGLRLSKNYNEEWAYSVSENAAGGGVTKVDSVTMDDVFRILGKDRIDLLKLDIEGAELDLFAAHSTEWLQHVECIAIELHDRLRPGCAKAFYSALADLDFMQEVRGENIFVQLCRAKRHPMGTGGVVNG